MVTTTASLLFPADDRRDYAVALARSTADAAYHQRPIQPLPGSADLTPHAVSVDRIGLSEGLLKLQGKAAAQRSGQATQSA